MCNGACRREVLSQDAALEYWKAEAARYRNALKTIHTVASKDGVAPELDRCYVYAANALMGKTEVSVDATQKDSEN